MQKLPAFVGLDRRNGNWTDGWQKKKKRKREQNKGQGQAIEIETETETGKQFITKAALSNALTRGDVAVDVAVAVLDVCLGLLQYRLMFTSWLLHYVVSPGTVKNCFVLFCFHFFSFNVLNSRHSCFLKGLRKSQQQINIHTFITKRIRINC